MQISAEALQEIVKNLSPKKEEEITKGDKEVKTAIDNVVNNTQGSPTVGQSGHQTAKNTKKIASNTKGGLKPIPVRPGVREGQQAYNKGLLARYPQLATPLAPGVQGPLDLPSGPTAIKQAKQLERRRLAGMDSNVLNRDLNALKMRASETEGAERFKALAEAAPIERELLSRKSVSGKLSTNLTAMMRKAMMQDYQGSSIPADPYGDTKAGQSAEAAKKSIANLLNTLRSSGQGGLIEIADAVEKEIKRNAKNDFQDLHKYAVALGEHNKQKAARAAAENANSNLQTAPAGDPKMAGGAVAVPWILRAVQVAATNVAVNPAGAPVTKTNPAGWAATGVAAAVAAGLEIYMRKNYGNPHAPPQTLSQARSEC